MRTYLLSHAASGARLHRPFWAALQVAAKHLKAEVVIQAGLWRSEEPTYPDELEPFLSRKRVRLAKKLTAFFDVPVAPTAVTPLSGLEVLCSDSSAILGHPRRQMQTVADGGPTPRVFWTTGAVTLPRYSDTKAGLKAAEHHVQGALIVEVCDDGTYFIRNITANKRTGAFTDLDKVYSPDGVAKAPRAQAVVLGDLHLGLTNECKAAQAAARGLVECVQPKNLVVHDVLDFDVDSHHAQKTIDRQRWREYLVEDSVDAACLGLSEISRWLRDMTTHVVASNHDAHLSRWMDEYDHKRDPKHFRFWVDCWKRQLEALGRDPFELAYNEYGKQAGDKVRFLKLGEVLSIAGIRCDLHGHIGAKGARGSLLAFSKLGTRTITGHSHSPGWRDGAVQIGTTSRLDLPYTRGAPSSMLNAHATIAADGKRQLLVTQRNKYRGSK